MSVAGSILSIWLEFTNKWWVIFPLIKNTLIGDSGVSHHINNDESNIFELDEIEK